MVCYSAPCLLVLYLATNCPRLTLVFFWAGIQPWPLLLLNSYPCTSWLWVYPVTLEWSYTHDWSAFPICQHIVNTSEECMKAHVDKPVQVATVSNLILYPAPREVFSLHLDLLDEFLNAAKAIISITVTTADGSVLLLHDDGLYGHNKNIYFSSTQTIDGLALAGVPRTEGDLEILTVDQRNICTTGGRALFLKLLFRLRKCHLGFLPIM